MSIYKCFYCFCLNSIFPSYFLVGLNDMPVLNFSEDAFQRCKNRLRGNGLSKTALFAFSVKCPLAPELGAESSIPNGPAVLLKPRRNRHGARGLHRVLPPTFAFPHCVPSAVSRLPCSALNCTAGCVAWLKKVFLLLSLQLPAGA